MRSCVATAPTTESTGVSRSVDVAELVRLKVVPRTVPLLVVSYLFAHLDRINIGFSKFQMSQDLGLSETTYGFGAGLFFIAYALFGVPGNMMLERFGPARWIALIMVVWGCLSSSVSLVTETWQFYLLRFLLGVAEAGFFPGILVYVNRWFPVRHRARVTALFVLAVPCAGLLGGPISGAILEWFDGFGGVRGWQWMFLMEGAPVVLLGLAVRFGLPETIERAAWLGPDERAALGEALADEPESPERCTLRDVCTHGDTWRLVAIYFAVMLAVNTLAFWMPSLIRSAGVDNDGRVGLLSALPYLMGCVAMIAVGTSSDRHGERRWHTCLPLWGSAAGLVLVALVPSDLPPEFGVPLVMGGLTVAAMGANTSLPMFWQLPAAFLCRRTQSVGIALIS